jgi:hypothetical protein
MAVIKWTTPAAIVTDLTTELNALANNAIAISVIIANNVERYADFELAVTYGTAPSLGGYVGLYAIQAVDGTNYQDAVDPLPASALLGVFPLRAVTTAQRIALRHCLLPAADFKVAVQNVAGQAMSASGHTVKHVTYSEESV